jgi:hypothetical protein
VLTYCRGEDKRREKGKVEAKALVETFSQLCVHVHEKLSLWDEIVLLYQRFYRFVRGKRTFPGPAKNGSRKDT